MKVILSRKGFDSAYGGYPSPILTDRKLISLPIPSNDITKYSDLELDDKKTYFDLMKQLNSRIKDNNGWHEINENTRCHLDPDIPTRIIQRKKDWKPCFGQINQAQSHLRKKGIKENDLFLFFGWFKKTICENGILQFDRSSPDLHVIFGYLQIGEIMQVNNKIKIHDWMQKHPHAIDEGRKNDPTNTIYIANDKLTWDESKSGAGVFRFNENLVLTKEGFSRSEWELPTFFKEVKISRHSERSWKEEGYFQSAPIGQEFIIEDNKEVQNWAKEKLTTAESFN